MNSALPRLRLKPKADARAIRHGTPWVYSDALVLDRRTKALPAGTIATLEDNNRAPLATVAVTPGSKITARVLDRAPDTDISQHWLEEKLATALNLREQLYDAPFYRLIHAEGDGLPGVIIDRFAETFVLQPNAAWAEQKLSELVAALVNVTGAQHVLKSASGRARALEGLDDVSGPLIGAPPSQVNVPMNDATYIADLASGQKTGLFYDQRPNHAFAAKLASGGAVLDVFSHVGGFALAALANGAQSALSIDGSAAALSLAQEGAIASGVSDRFSTLKSDAFTALEQLQKDNTRFDVVICDPPAFAPSKSALQAGLRAYERVARLAAPLVKPNGFLMVCSCSHAADLPKFRSASLRGIGRAGRTGQIVFTGGAGPDHPLHPSLGETGYLKALALRLF